MVDPPIARGLAASAPVQGIAEQQGGDPAAAGKQGRIFEQHRHEIRFRLGFGRRWRHPRRLRCFDRFRWLDRGGCHRLGLFRLRRLLGLGRLQRLGGFDRSRDSDLRRFDRLRNFNGFGRFDRLDNLDWLDRFGGLAFFLLAQLLLQVGQALVLHLQQLLHFADVLFEHGQAFLRLLQGLFAGNRIGFAGSGLGTALADQFGTRHTQLILGCLGRSGLVVALGGNLSATGLPGLVACRRRRRCGSQLLAVSLPVAGMADIYLARFGRGYRGDRLAVGNTEDRTGLHPVNIVSEEGIRILAIQRNQHLLQRYFFRLALAGNLAQGIAGLHDPGRPSRHFRRWPRFRFVLFVALAGRERLRHLGRRHRCRLLRLACDRRRLVGPYGIAHRLDHLGLGDRRCGLAGLDLGRVEQEGVFPHQAAGRPVQLNQKIEEGFVDRLVRGDLDHRSAVRPLIDDKAQIGQGRRIFDTGLTESVLRSKTGRHPGQLFARSAKIEFGPQRLTERGQDRQLAQTGRIRPHMQQRETGGDGQCGCAFF